MKLLKFNQVATSAAVNLVRHEVLILTFFLSFFFSIITYRPTYATPKVLERAGLKMEDIDVFEYHEAFAVSHL